MLKKTNHLIYVPWLVLQDFLAITWDLLEARTSSLRKEINSRVGCVYNFWSQKRQACKKYACIANAFSYMYVMRA